MLDLRNGSETSSQTGMQGGNFVRPVVVWVAAGLALAGTACAADDHPVQDRGGGSREALAVATAAQPVGPWSLTAARAPVQGHGYRHDWRVGLLDSDHDDYHAYRLPYGDGVSFPVLQSYGSKLSHQGAEFYTVDFEMPEGTPVHAARDGVVALVEESNEEGCWAEHCGRLANYVVILHRDGTTSEYFHLRRNGVVVEAGSRVSAGQWIALSGNTGYTTTPHLHFGVYGARTGGGTQSIGVRFNTRSGVIRELRLGGRYLNSSSN